MQSTSVANLVTRNGPLSIGMAVDITDALAQCLLAQSIQPALLVRLRPEIIEVMRDPDLGLLRVTLLDSTGPTDRPYMAWPEFGAWWSGLIRSDTEVGGEPAGVYCTAVLLYHMLTGSPLFVEDDLLRLALRHLNEDALGGGRIREIPPSSHELLRIALARRRAERFPTIAAFRAALAAAKHESSLALDRFSLRSRSSGRCYRLATCVRQTSSGAVIGVGRSDAHTRHVADLDLGREPRGRGVHRRQALIRIDVEPWTIEEWIEPASPRGPQGKPTAVNGRALHRREMRVIRPGDVIAFGPIVMDLVIDGDEEHA